MKEYLIGSLREIKDIKLFELAYDCLKENTVNSIVTNTPQDANSKQINAQVPFVCENQLFLVKSYFSSKSQLIKAQTYKKWKASYGMNWCLKRKLAQRPVIYLLPFHNLHACVMEQTIRLGEIKDGGPCEDLCSLLELCREFVEIFFRDKKCVLLPVCDTQDTDWKLTERQKYGGRQILVRDFYVPLKRLLPTDGYCVMGITGSRLYPAEEYKAVLGESSFHHRSGVFTLYVSSDHEGDNSDGDERDITDGSHSLRSNEHRIDPNGCGIHDDQSQPQTWNADVADEGGCARHVRANEVEENPSSVINGTLVWKLFRVLSHELCHLFHLGHCDFFHCAMNESQSADEAFTQPLFLCPVCLRKLMKVCGFNIRSRYEQMHKLLTNVNRLLPSSKLQSSIDWVNLVLEFLTVAE